MAPTIEVRDAVVRQVRGKCNHPPTSTVLELVTKWAKRNRLRIADY